MSSPTQYQNHSSRPFKKKVIRMVSFLFLSLLFLEFIIYFGSNLFLSEWAERKINRATKNVYKIDFDRFNFSLLRRGVFLDGFSMTPVAGQAPSQDQALFSFTLDHLSLQNLWYSFTDDVFYIGKIELNNPDAKLQLTENFEGSKQTNTNQKTKLDPNFHQKSAAKQLEEEIQKSIKRLRFDAVFIKEVEINHADLFFYDFLSKNSLKAENTRLHIKNIDWTTQEDWKSPFNASGYEFKLENIYFPLPDGVHSLSADKAFVSSEEQLIDLTNFNLAADKSKESKSYYDVTLKKLKIASIDLNKAFMTSEVEIEELVLNDPIFNIIRNNNIKKENIATGDLNELIDGLLKSIQIKELSINNGKFSKNDFGDSLKNRIDFKGLDFKMLNFYLGNDASKKENQFFYGEDASMEIKDVSLFLADQIHFLKGQKVLVSSFKDLIQIQNFSIQPTEKAKIDPNSSSLIELKLPEFEMEGVDLKKLYGEGILEVDVMKLLAPQIEYTDNQNPISKKDFSSAADLIKDWVAKVVIGKFDLQDGVLQFKEKVGTRSNDIEFEKFSLILENIVIQPGKSIKTWQEFLIAEEIVLSLDTYRLKLKDNLHEFIADKVLIDSEKSLVEISGFELRPEKPDQIPAALDAYRKTSAINLKVPKFRLEGVDLLAALVDHELLIKQIIVFDPEMSLVKYRNVKDSKLKDLQNQLESSEEFEALLTSYFDKIQIDSVVFSEAKIGFASQAGNKKISFNEDNLSLNLRGFLVEKGKKTDKKGTFFSDEIDLNLKNYSFSIAGGNYLVETDGLKYNSRERSLSIDDFVLRPGPELKSKLAFSLRMPQVLLVGIDIETFLFQNELVLDQFKVVGGEIEIEINPEIKPTDQKEAKKKASLSEAAIRKVIELLKVNKLDFQNSKLTINYRSGERDVQSIKTDFDLFLTDLNLDSTFSREWSDLSEFYSALNLSLQDFSYNLPDSIHQIKFSELAFDNLAHETTFSNVQIIPKTKSPKNGVPIFDGTIEKIGIQTNALKKILETGEIELGLIRIQKPVFTVFMDKDSKSGAREGKINPNEQPFFHSILLQDVLIQNGKVDFHDNSGKLIPSLAFQKVYLDAKNLGIDLLKKNGGFDYKSLVNKKLNFSFEDYSLIIQDSMNRFSVGKISYWDGNLELDKISYVPLSGDYEYGRALGYQTDVIHGLAKKLAISKIDLNRYFSDNVLKADKITLEELDLNIFRDKRIPVLPGVIKKMPQELMANFGREVKIDSFLIQNSTIKYREFAEKSFLPGMIFFNDLQASFSPVFLSRSGSPFPLDSSGFVVEAKLMGTGLIQLDGQMVFKKPYPMNLTVQMGDFDLTLLNDFLRTGSFVQIQKGNTSLSNWDFTLDENKALGSMNFHYEDLKIALVDSLTLHKKRKFYSMLANLFIRNRNPRPFWNKDVVSPIYFERDTSKFVFNAWWKASFSGLKGSIGLGKPKMPKRKEEE